jgi:hypothetical protein
MIFFYALKQTHAIHALKEAEQAGCFNAYMRLKRHVGIEAARLLCAVAQRLTCCSAAEQAGCFCSTAYLLLISAPVTDGR